QRGHGHARCPHADRTGELMPSSTKWRLNVTARNDSTYVGLAKLSMCAAPGGADLCTGGTASASSVYGAGYEAAKAFDADPLTYWSTVGGALPAQLQYDFPSAVAITSYRLQVENNGQYAPKDWTLEYWDGAAWQVTDTQT